MFLWKIVYPIFWKSAFFHLETLEKILLSRNVLKEDAESLAEIFANNSLDGVYSHGANRFPRLIEYMDKGEKLCLM